MTLRMGLLLALAILPAVGSSGDAAAAFEAQLLPWLEEAIDSAALRHLLRYPDLPLAQQLAVRSGPHGHALHARVGFEAGESILPIPASRLLRDRGTGQAALSWSLAKHRQQEHSRLAPYFAVLPDHHPERPAHWGAELLREHLQGSGFPEYVDEREQGVWLDFESLQQRGRRGPSWEQYRWAHDTVATRAMAADSHNRWLLFPLADLSNHADDANIKVRWQTVDAVRPPLSPSLYRSKRTAEELVVSAVRRIEPGDELLNGYVEYGQLSTWQSLELWCAQTASRRCFLSVSSPSENA